MAISIDVGTSVVHIITGQARSGHVTVADCQLVRVPAEILAESQEYQQREVFTLIRPAVESMRAKRMECHFTLSDDRFLLRDLTVPKAPESDLRGIAKQEMISLYNASEDDLVEIGSIAHQPDDKVSLRAAAFNKNLVEGYIKYAVDFSFIPKTLSYHSYNIGKLVSAKPEINGFPIAGRTVLLADLGMFSCIIHVITDGRSVFSRYLPVGFNDLYHILTQSNNLGEKQAVYGPLVATFDSGSREFMAYSPQIVEQVKTFFYRLSDEMSKILRFLFSSRIADNVDALFLFGGSALIPELERRLGEAIAVRTEAVRYVSTLKISGDSANKVHFLLNCAGSLI